MARINIEDCWWTDPRREKLGSLVGSLLLADAIVIRAWRVGQEFWGNKRGLIPKHVFATLEAGTSLVQANLAEERENGFYIRGSSQYLDWLIEQRELASLAGKKSAAIRREKHGTAQPKRRTDVEQAPNDTRTPSNALEPSYSYSYSGSKKEIILSAVVKKPHARKQLFSPKDLGEIIQALDRETKDLWKQLYPDTEYLERESLRAWDYYRDAGRKRPTTLSGWKKVMGGWFERGWTKHAASISRSPQILKFVVPD